MPRNPYPIDVSDEEWSFAAAYLALMTQDAPQREHSLREVFNALRWIVRAGSPWRLLAEEHGLSLRQNYNRIAPRLATQIGRYAYTKQFKRMRRAVRTLRSRVGRVQRDVARQLGELPEQAQAKVSDLLARTARILTQRTKDLELALCTACSEVECISKGKARTPYEFGVKVSIATTLKEELVIAMRSMPGNLYDGPTLAETLEQVGILAERKPVIAIVDKGYQGVEIEGVRILRSGQKRGITRTLKAMIHRRSAIEPAIGRMLMDGRLGRNPLKGALSDALHAVMCGAGHNLRLILAKLRLLAARFGLTSHALLAALLTPVARTQLTRT